MTQGLLDRCVLASRTFPPLTWPQPIACAPRPSVVRGNRRPTATGYGNRVGMSPHGGRHRSPPATRRRFSGCLTHSTCGARCGGAKQPRCPTFVARPQLMLAVENAQRDANHCRDPAAHPNLHQQCETRVADRLAAFASGCRVASPPRRCAPRFLYHAWSVGRGLPQRRGHLCLHWTRHDVWSWQRRSPRPAAQLLLAWLSPTRRAATKDPVATRSGGGTGLVPCSNQTTQRRLYRGRVL